MEGQNAHQETSKLTAEEQALVMVGNFPPSALQNSGVSALLDSGVLALEDSGASALQDSSIVSGRR